MIAKYAGHARRVWQDLPNEKNQILQLMCTMIGHLIVGMLV